MNKQTIISKAIHNSQKKRSFKNKLFKFTGLFCVCIAIFFLLFIFYSIIKNAIPALHYHELKLEVDLANQDYIQSNNIQDSNFQGLIKHSLRNLFPEVKTRKQKKLLYKIISPSASFELIEYIKANSNLLNSKINYKFSVSDDVDQFYKGKIDLTINQDNRRIKDIQIRWLEHLQKQKLIETNFNYRFFINSDSRDASIAGIKSAFVGSLMTIFITFVLSFIFGVAAAIYLEEFAPKNKLTKIIEVNINNLAAVPSIVFGLLGLGVLLNFFQLPRGSSLVGGIILTLMTMPTIIIATRSSLKAVPKSIKDAAYGLGASRMETVFHHTTPIAMPGIITGSIIGISQALGETAPLLMIGMVAFIADTPSFFDQPAVTLPVQIYLWADSFEKGLIDKSFLLILLMLLFLLFVNSIAIILRNKYSKRFKGTF